MPPIKNARLLALLEGLNQTEYIAPPNGVGLKTGLRAVELGLVQWNHDVKAARFKLTKEGLVYRWRFAKTVQSPRFPSG